MFDRSFVLVGSIGFIVMGSLACESESDVLGTYVDLLFVDGNESSCAGTDGNINRYIERVFDFFGEDVPRNFQVPARIGGEDDCPGSSACYVPGERTIYLPELDNRADRAGGALRHELTHAVMHTIWGPGAPFFSEGVVEVMSQTRVRSGVDDGMPVPVGEMLAMDAVELDYSAAAYFVRFLIDTRGLDRFERMFRGSKGRSGGQIKASFDEIYGQSFEVIQSEYLAGPPSCRYQLDLCDPRAAVAVGSSYRIAAPLSCNDPDCYGSSSGGDLQIETQRTIALDTGGTYHLRVAFEASAGAIDRTVWLVRCGDCSEQSTRSVLGIDGELQMEAGLYVFEISNSLEGILTLSLDRVGEGEP